MAHQRKTNTRTWERDGAIDFVAEALRRAYPIGTAKHVASDLGVSHRTAEKWCQQESAPSLHQFLNACQQIPELNAAMRQLLGMGETDPAFQRALSELVTAAQRMKP